MIALLSHLRRDVFSPVQSGHTPKRGVLYIQTHAEAHALPSKQWWWMVREQRASSTRW